MGEKHRLLGKPLDEELAIFKEFVGTFGDYIQWAGMGKKT
jgi:hypothetical protein